MALQLLVRGNRGKCALLERAQKNPFAVERFLRQTNDFEYFFTTGLLEIERIGAGRIVHASAQSSF